MTNRVKAIRSRAGMLAVLAPLALLSGAPVTARAQVAYADSGAATVTGSTTTCTPAMPASIAANDILLLVVESENQPISLGTPNGFVEVPNSPQFAGTAATTPANRIAVYWKRAVGGDAAPVVADPGDHVTCAVHRFTGAITTGDPWDVTAGGNDAGLNDAAGVIPGATTAVANTLVVLVQGTSNNGNSTANCSGWTNATLGTISERFDSSNTAGLGGGHCLATASWVGPGAYGDTTLTLGATTYKGALSMALKPAPPTVPGTPAASGQTVSGFTAGWTASAGATSYTLDLDTENTFAAPLTATYTPATNSQAVTALAANTLHYMRVSATGPGGTSAYSATGQGLTLPGAPAMAAYTGVGQTAATVNWTSPGGTGALTYDVERAPDAGGTPGTFAPVGACQGLSATSCSDTGLTAGTTYWYQVHAVNAAGSGAFGTSTSVTTSASTAPPGAPGTPTYSNVTDASFTVAWTASVTGATPISYALQYSTTGAAPWVNVAGCSGAGLLTCGVTGLSANTRFYYQVYATNAYGNATSASSSQLTLPGAPTMAGYTAVGGSSVTVNWASPGGTGALTYDVRRAPDVGGTPGSFAPVAACQGVSATSCSDTGVAAATTYWYQVRAVNAAGGGAFATPTSVTTTAPALAVADGTNPAGAAICPGGSAQVDGFTMQAGSGTASVTGVTVALTPAGAFRNVASVQVACGAATGTNGAVASDVVPVGIAVSIGAASPTSCTVTVTAKADAALATAGNLGVAATVSGVTVSGFAPAISDASNAFTIDNAPPASVVDFSAISGDAQVLLSWTNPPSDFARSAVVRRQGSAVTFAPTDGTDYALNSTPVAGETVIYAEVGTTFTDSPLTNGTSYHYELIARDACNNWSSAAVANATPSSFVADGDATPGSVKPVVSVVNPMNGGIVAASFRLQARVFSPRTSGGVAQPITGVALLIDGTASGFTMSPIAAYGTTTESGIWGTEITTLATGSHALRVTATNASGTVYSGTLTVTVVPAGTGDGKLVVRDNASQLCSDCHAMQTHSSEATGNALGSWAVTCRECHTPHGTTNLELVRTRITPPALEGPTTEKTVVFQNKTGYADGSYASAANNGPCQVCHTRTDYYRSTGPGPGGAHETGNCATCHVHNKGLAASCTNCHGTEGRASIAGADNRQSAAPPAIAAGSVSVPGGGAHVAHVNQARWRTNPLPCAACHPAPHATRGATDIAWSTLATGNGAIPPATMNPPGGTLGSAWPTTPSCTNWCHGGGMPAGGGSLTSPAWTGTATSASCGTCHASPPPVGGGAGRDHPQNVACAACHGGDYAQGAIGTTSKGTHVDGTIQKPNNGCTACHGKLAGPAPAVAVGSTSPEAAPGYDALAVDTQGNTSTTVPLPVGVGAHGKHVNAGMMSAKACNVCHPLPADLDTSHANGAVQMAWSSPATSGGVTPGYARPTCTNYCHSSGDPMGAATPATSPISWTAAGSLGCSSCHASTAIATNAHGKHVPRYACNECHVGTTLNGTSIVTGGGLHVNGANDVAFDASSQLVQGGSWSPPSSPTNPATCSNVYCHSNGTDRTAPYTNGPSLAWNAGPTTCTSCHGGPAGASQIATGKHPNHVNVAGTIGGAASTNLECGTCHAATVAVNTNAPVTGAAAHVDRVASVSFDPFYGGSFAQGATEGTGSCASSYCHSSGQDPAATPAIIQYLNVAWNDAALGCDGCHGRYGGGAGNGTGAPNYPSGGEGTPTANSHARHASSATDCAVCHAGTATAAGNAILSTSALHLDKQRQVQIDGTHDSNGATGNYDPAAKQCSGITCHGVTGTPRWGGPPMKCSDCHAGASDTDSFALLTPGSISTSEWTARGHGQSTFGANTFPSLAGGTPCLYCHDAGSNHRDGSNPFRLRGSTLAGGGAGAAYSAATPSSANQVCLNCHAVSGANGVDPADGGALGTNPAITSTKKIDAYHAGSKHGAANGGTRCWDCHDAHGDGSNVAMIGADVVRTATDNHSFAATRVTGVAFTANATGTDYAGAGTKICNACHTGTLYYLASGTGNQTHQSGARCVACHGHEQTPNLAFKEATACNGCHNSPPTVGNHTKHVQAIQGSPAYGSTTIGSSGTTYGYQCGVCHTTVAANHANDIGGTAADPYNVNVAFSIGAVTTYTQGATPATETGPTGLVFRGTNGTCGTVYCHDPLGAVYTGTNVNWTQTPGSLGCTACHPMNGATSTALTNRHDQHINAPTGTPAGYGYGCERCHSSTTTTGNTITNTAQHAVGTHNVAFNSNPVNQTGGSYTVGSNGACGSTYCHSNGQSTSSFGPPNVALNWNAASGTATCSSCHGGATGTIIASGSHTQHVNSSNLAALGTVFHCDDCHATTAAGGTTPTVNVAGGLHVNGAKDGSIPARNGMVSTFGTTCSAVYCHSSGRPATAGSTAASKYASVAWGQAGTLDCKGCHGTYVAADGAAFGWTTLYGEPNYANTSAGAVDANSHYKHVLAGATTCAICHQQTSTTGTSIVSSSTLHADGFRNVTWDATRQAAGATYNQTNKTCGSTGASCHGAKTPQWGQVLTCAGCHGTEPRPKDASVGGVVDANVIGAPPTGLGGETATTARAVGAHISHVNQGTFRQDAVTCAECHSGTSHNGTKQVAFGTLARTGAVTPSWTGTGCSLTYCHGNFANGNDNVVYATPGAPTNLAFTSVTNTSLTLGWTAANGAVFYKIERAPDASGVPGTFVQIAISSTTSYADGGLFDGTTYWYRVRAWSPSGDGAYSASASQKTNGGMMVTEFDMVGEDSATSIDGGTTNVGTTLISLTANTTVGNRNIATPNYVYADTTQRRDRPSAAITTGTYYFVDLFTPALTAANNTVAASATVSIDNYMNTTSTANPGYWTVTLYEFNPTGSVSTSRGTCTAAYNATVTTFQTSTCTLNNAQFQAAVGNRLKLRIQINAVSGSGRPALLWGATRVTSGTMAGQTYFTANLGTPLPTVPAAPTASPTLTTGIVTSSSVAMSWTAVTGATSYVVERGAGATPAAWTQVAQPTGTSFTDQALAASTTYSYRVRGVNAGGAGPNATARTVTTAAPPPTIVTSWTGTFTAGSTSLTCASCHGNPPGGTHPAADGCSACHPGYSDKSAVPQTVDKTKHINGVVDTGDCVGCHSVQNGGRRAVVAEFGMKWSHKRSAGGTVTKWDCVVCHMEGDPATGDRSAVHMDGVVNLRDPDVGTNIKGVTFSGTPAPGSYASTATDVTFTAFRRDLGVTLENDPNFLTLAAIQINQCLKCHDVDGARAFDPGNPLNVMASADGVTRSAAIPFGTAISYASVPAAEGGTTSVPSGAGITAGGVPGGVIDVNASLATGNSSYHPVRGKQNNWYAKDARMFAPWDMGVTTRSGTVNTTTWGPLLSCWDCHALPTDSGPIDSTVTAHGGTATLRGNGAATTTSAPTATTGATLCWVCHKGYNASGSSHGTGSALSGSTNSQMTVYLQYGCNRCHSSNYTTVVVRPVRAQDVHGFDRLAGTGADALWPVGTTETRKPYAFIRNTTSLSDHQPASIGGTTYTATCVHLNDTPCNSRTESYSVGGTY